MASIVRARSVRAALLVALAGCSTAPEPAVGQSARSASAADATRAPAQAPFTDDSFPGRLARVEVRSQGVTLLLPDASAWQGEAAGTWSLLRHDATGSKLWLKHWRAARLVRPDECLALARLGQPAMIVLRDEEIVERRSMTTPPGFTGEVVVAVRELGRELHGYAELSSAGIGRCLVAVFHTVTNGAGREQELGRRLAVIVDNTFERARTRAVEDRVAR
jgi:hypothetical protein